MEGQSVPGSLQSIAHWRAKNNGNGLKNTFSSFLWPLTQPWQPSRSLM
jgi:hypothetical protein